MAPATSFFRKQKGEKEKMLMEISHFEQEVAPYPASSFKLKYLINQIQQRHAYIRRSPLQRQLINKIDSLGSHIDATTIATSIKPSTKKS